MDAEFISKDDLEVLERTRNLRIKLVEKIVNLENGEIEVPDGASDKILLSTLLKHVDDEILARARLKAAVKTTDGIANAASLVAEALRKFQPGNGERSRSNTTQLPDTVPDLDPLPGEMDIGTVNLTHKDLIVPDVVDEDE